MSLPHNEELTRPKISYHPLDLCSSRTTLRMSTTGMKLLPSTQMDSGLFHPIWTRVCGTARSTRLQRRSRWSRCWPPTWWCSTCSARKGTFTALSSRFWPFPLLGRTLKCPQILLTKVKTLLTLTIPPSPLSPYNVICSSSSTDCWVLF